MTVKFSQEAKVKPKAATKVVPKGQTSELELNVGKFVTLHRKLMEMEAFELLKEYEALKKVLSSEAMDESYDHSKQVTFESDDGAVIFSAAAKRTRVSDKEAMVKAMGDKLFAELATVSVTDLKKYLGEVQIADFTEQYYSHRTVASVSPSLA